MSLLGLKRESCTYAHVGHLHFLLEGSVSQVIRIWAEEKSPIGSFQWRGKDKGRHTCGNKRPDSSTSARNCSESPLSNPAWTWGWTFLITSQKPERKDEEDRHFFSLIMRKNDTQEVFLTFLQYGLSFKSNEREMNTENSGCATKKRHTPEQNPELKRHYKGIFSHTELIKWPLCFQSPENH